MNIDSAVVDLNTRPKTSQYALKSTLQEYTAAAARLGILRRPTRPLTTGSANPTSTSSIPVDINPTSLSFASPRAWRNENDSGRPCSATFSRLSMGNGRSYTLPTSSRSEIRKQKVANATLEKTQAFSQHSTEGSVVSSALASVLVAVTSAPSIPIPHTLPHFSTVSSGAISTTSTLSRYPSEHNQGVMPPRTVLADQPVAILGRSLTSRGSEQIKARGGTQGEPVSFKGDATHERSSLSSQVKDERLDVERYSELPVTHRDGECNENNGDARSKMKREADVPETGPLNQPTENREIVTEPTYQGESALNPPSPLLPAPSSVLMDAYNKEEQSEIERAAQAITEMYKKYKDLRTKEREAAIREIRTKVDRMREKGEDDRMAEEEAERMKGKNWGEADTGEAIVVGDGEGTVKYQRYRADVVKTISGGVSVYGIGGVDDNILSSGKERMQGRTGRGETKAISEERVDKAGGVISHRSTKQPRGDDNNIVISIWEKSRPLEVKRHDTEQSTLPKYIDGANRIGMHEAMRPLQFLQSLTSQSKGKPGSSMASPSPKRKQQEQEMTTSWVKRGELTEDWGKGEEPVSEIGEEGYKKPEAVRFIGSLDPATATDEKRLGRRSKTNHHKKHWDESYVEHPSQSPPLLNSSSLVNKECQSSSPCVPERATSLPSGIVEHAPTRKSPVVAPIASSPPSNVYVPTVQPNDSSYLEEKVTQTLPLPALTHPTQSVHAKKPYTGEESYQPRLKVPVEDSEWTRQARRIGEERARIRRDEENVLRHRAKTQANILALAQRSMITARLASGE